MWFPLAPCASNIFSSKCENFLCFSISSSVPSKEISSLWRIKIRCHDNLLILNIMRSSQIKNTVIMTMPSHDYAQVNLPPPPPNVNCNLRIMYCTCMEVNPNISNGVTMKVMFRISAQYLSKQGNEFTLEQVCIRCT